MYMYAVTPTKLIVHVHDDDDDDDDDGVILTCASVPKGLLYMYVYTIPKEALAVIAADANQCP